MFCAHKSDVKRNDSPSCCCFKIPDLVVDSWPTQKNAWTHQNLIIFIYVCVQKLLLDGRCKSWSGYEMFGYAATPWWDVGQASGRYGRQLLSIKTAVKGSSQKMTTNTKKAKAEVPISSHEIPSSENLPHLNIWKRTFNMFLQKF